MASNDILGCTAALTQFFLDNADDDTENLDIYHVIDMTEFCDSPDFENESPVHVTETPPGYHFKSFVKKLRSDNFLISLVSCSGKLDNDLTWPIEVEFTVHVINENIDKSLKIGSRRLVLNKPKPGVCDHKTYGDIEVDIKDLNHFVIDNNLMLKCSVKLTLNQKSSNDFSQSEIPQRDSSSFVQNEKPNFKDHLSTLFLHNQLVWETLKSKRYQDEIAQLVSDIVECRQDDKKIEIFECRIDNFDKRIGDIKDKFKEQQEEILEWLKNVRKTKHTEKAITDRLKEQLLPRTEFLDSSDGQTPSVLPDMKSTICEVVQKPMIRNFLLIGPRWSGKGATGNSILLKRVFETGPMKRKGLMFQSSAVTLSGIPIEITVVKRHDGLFGAKVFELCPEGFDAVLNVVRYDQIFKGYAIRTELNEFDGKIEKKSILNAFGVLIITGRDMYDFDNQGKQEEHISLEDKCYENLKTECQDRVILFDNITQSEQKQHYQLEKLLELVNCLPSKTDKFTIEWLREDFKRELSNLHLPQDKKKIMTIINKYNSYYRLHKSYFHLHDCQRIETALFKTGPAVSDLGQQVVVFGEPCDAFISALQKMSINVKKKTVPDYLIFDCHDATLLNVVPCTGLSTIQETSLKEFIKIAITQRRYASILIVTDDKRLNLSKDKFKFIEWCEQQTGLFSDIFHFHSRRAVLFDYETDDAVTRIEQEADLLENLNTLNPRDFSQIIHDKYGGLMVPYEYSFPSSTSIRTLKKRQVRDMLFKSPRIQLSDTGAVKFKKVSDFIANKTEPEIEEIMKVEKVEIEEPQEVKKETFLFDYETDNVVTRIEQEADLLENLNTLNPRDFSQIIHDKYGGLMVPCEYSFPSSTSIRTLKKPLVRDMLFKSPRIQLSDTGAVKFKKVSDFIANKTEPEIEEIMKVEKVEIEEPQEVKEETFFITYK